MPDRPLGSSPKASPPICAPAFSRPRFPPPILRSLIGEGGIPAAPTAKFRATASASRVRFKGQYSISLSFSGKPRLRYSLPGTFEVDTLQADQDLGDLAVAATGSLIVRLVNTSPQAASSPPSQLTLFFQSAENASGASAQLNLDPTLAEQTVGPIAVGQAESLAPGLWLSRRSRHPDGDDRIGPSPPDRSRSPSPPKA